MKKHKGKIQMGIVIGIFSVIIIACLISIFSRLYAENKETEEFRQLAEIVTEETTNTDTETEIVWKYTKAEQFTQNLLISLISYKNDITIRIHKK